MSDLNSIRAEMVAAYQKNDFDKTLNAAEAILKRDSSNIEALRYAVRIHTNRKDQAKAQVQWARLVELAPEIPEPHLQLARIFRQQKRWSDCLQYIESYLLFSPEHAEANSILVQCHIHLKMSHKIGTSFARLITLQSNGATTIARQASNLGMSADIATSLRKLADNGDEDAIALCRSLARSERMAGLGFEIQKNLYLAAQSYRTMRDLDPESEYPTTSLARLRKPFLERARKAYQAEDDARAIEHAMTSIKIEPNEAEPYIIAGRSAARSGDERAAFEHLDRGMKHCPPNIWLCINFARAAERCGEYLQAYEGFSEILKNSEDSASAQYQAEAQRSFDRIPQRLVSKIRKQAESGEYLSAMSTTETLSEDGVIEDDALSALRDHITNHTQRGLRAAYDANAPEALELAKTLATFAPERDYAQRVAGRLLMRNRAYEEAAKYWQNLCRMNPESIEFQLNLARSYHRSGNTDKAQVAARALLKLDASHQEGAQLLGAIGS